MSNLGKRIRWLNLYLNPDNKETYLDPAACAIAVGYCCRSKASYYSIGAKLRKRFYKKIAEHMDSIQSIESIRQTFEELRNAKRMQYFAKDGIVTDEREVAAHDIRLGAAKELAKIHGMYAPTTININELKAKIAKDIEDLNV